MDYTDIYLRIDKLRKDNTSGIVVVKILKNTKRYNTKKFWNTTDIILFFEEHDSLLCLNNGRFNMFNRNSPEVKALLHKIEDESCPFGDDIGLKILSGGSDHKWLFTAPFGVEQTVFVQDVILRYKESLHK